ncbi:MAG: amino acid ABC transporter permease [Geminicoccaceae bacterium]
MNYHFNFTLIWRNFDKIGWGLVLSLELAVICVAIGVFIGLLGAIIYSDGPRWLGRVVTAYVEFIRNVPLILLVYLMFYGIPSAGGFSYGPVESFIITLSLYAGAYLVEVFRAGLDAVPKGLLDAGKAIGLTPVQRFLYVRLPTMFRIALPSLSNTFVSLFKDTSVASVIAVPELAYAANWINFSTFRIVEVYAVVTPIYLVTGYTILFLLRLLERRYAIRR